MIYAVLLAFIAVVVWEDFRKADALVQTEANLVGNLYRDTVGLPDPLASGLRHTLFVYAETVVQDEWPALDAGRVEDAAGWQLLDKFHLALAQFRPADPGVQAIEAEMFRSLNALYDARRGRFHAAEEELPPILWWNLIAGAGLTILFSTLFGVPNFAMHVVMVAHAGRLDRPRSLPHHLVGQSLQRPEPCLRDAVRAPGQDGGGHGLSKGLTKGWAVRERGGSQSRAKDAPVRRR